MSRRLIINPIAIFGVVSRASAGRPVRLVLITMGTIIGAAGVACAVSEFFTHEIPRKGGEERALVQISAPYGSLVVGSTSSPGLVAYLEGHGDDGEEPSMRSRYVMRGTTGILNLNLGEDEGHLQNGPPLASLQRANTGLTLVGGKNDRYSDWGETYRMTDAASYEANYQAIEDAGYNVRRISYAPAHSSTRVFLTKDLPLTLDAEMGFGESLLDLSGLWLQNLNLETGANQAKVLIRSQNPGSMDNCTVSAGVGEFSMEGIGHLNTSKFDFNGGFGMYSLNFAGKLKKNLEAKLSVGLGRLSVRVPADAGRLQVFYDDGVFCSYNFSGLVKRKDGYATSAGFDKSNAPVITLRITSGAGKVNVVYK